MFASRTADTDPRVARLASLNSEIALRKPKAAQAQSLGLLEWIPKASPDLQSPYHLAPLVDVFERAYLAARGLGPPVFALVSAPPQVGKTLTGQHALARWLELAPADFLAYVSYGQDLASKKSRGVRDLVLGQGIKLRGDSNAVDLWELPLGGGLLARGRDGGITGQSAVRLLWIDDPYKNRSEADSKRMRDAIDEDLRSTCFSRRHPFTSVILSHTRWHEDDEIGRLRDDHGHAHSVRWEHHNIRAVEDDGRCLWEESGRDAAFWSAQRALVKEYAWWSLYQGEPRPRGGKVFNGTGVYQTLPAVGRYAIGIDLAYSADTQSDWSVAVVLCRGSDDRYYVADMKREQCSAPDFVRVLRALHDRYPSAPMMWYRSGTEKGSGDFIVKAGIPLIMKAPVGDKYQRAIPVAAAWNPDPQTGAAGRVLLPDVERGVAPWVDQILDEVLEFTGTGGDANDDIVDALGTAYDALQAGGGSVVVTAKPKETRPYGRLRRERPYG